MCCSDDIDKFETTMNDLDRKDREKADKELFDAAAGLEEEQGALHDPTRTHPTLPYPILPCLTVPYLIRPFLTLLYLHQLYATLCDSVYLKVRVKMK